jgi:hypothetical protein
MAYPQSTVDVQSQGSNVPYAGARGGRLRQHVAGGEAMEQAFQCSYPHTAVHTLYE